MCVSSPSGCWCTVKASLLSIQLVPPHCILIRIRHQQTLYCFNSWKQTTLSKESLKRTQNNPETLLMICCGLVSTMLFPKCILSGSSQVHVFVIIVHYGSPCLCFSCTSREDSASWEESSVSWRCSLKCSEPQTNGESLTINPSLPPPCYHSALLLAASVSVSLLLTV